MCVQHISGSLGLSCTASHGVVRPNLNGAWATWLWRPIQSGNRCHLRPQTLEMWWFQMISVFFHSSSPSNPSGMLENRPGMSTSAMKWCWKLQPSADHAVVPMQNFVGIFSHYNTKTRWGIYCESKQRCSQSLDCMPNQHWKYSARTWHMRFNNPYSNRYQLFLTMTIILNHQPFTKDYSACHVWQTTKNCLYSPSGASPLSASPIVDVSRCRHCKPTMDMRLREWNWAREIAKQHSFSKTMIDNGIISSDIMDNYYLDNSKYKTISYVCNL